MVRDTIKLENVVSTISQEYLLEFTSEYGIPEGLHLELPGLEDTIVDFPEGKVGVYTKFFEFANFRIPISEFLFDILGHYQIHLSQLSVIGAAKVGHFEINWEKHPTVLYKTPGLLKKLEQSIFLGGRESISHRRGLALKRSEGWDTNSGLLFNGERNSIKHTLDPYPKTTRSPIMPDMDLFKLISAPNLTKVKAGTRPRAAYEVPLLTVTASRVIDMEDPTAATESSRTPSTIEKSPLDFSNENPSQQITKGDGTEDQVLDEVSREIPPEANPTTTGVVLELEKEVTVMGPRVNKRRRKRANDEADANASRKVLRNDHAAAIPEQNTHRGKSLASMGLEAGTTFVTPATQEALSGAKSVSDPNPLSYARPQPYPERDMAQSSKEKAPEIPSEHVATTEEQGQKLMESPQSGKSSSFLSMDGSPGDIYQPKWGMTNNCRLDTSNVCKDTVDHIVPSGTVETEVKGLRNQTGNLGTLLEAEVDMKKVAETKNAELTEEIKAAFEEFKKYEDERVNSRCVEMDARLDALSIDFDEELYPHMLTAIAGHRWVIGHDIRLAVMKCVESSKIRQAFADVVFAGLAKGISEGLKYGVEHGKAGRYLADIKAYDPEDNNKLVKALQDLKDLKYPMVDQLERLKDARMEIVMASFHLESDTEEDAPQWIRDLRMSSSQLKIHVYPEVRDPEDPWAVKEEMLEDAIAANRSQGEKKKKCRVVCRTHGIGSAHHARFDGVPVSVPTIASQGLAILLADAATQTKTSEDEASLRLLRSKSLPPMYNLDWP
ncbi:hypothetical protein Tco_0027334 [Tanacetum coccineum]